MPEDKSTIQYDTGISESRFISDTRLFLKSTADNQTEVYRADTKLEKFAMLKEPIDVFNQKDTWKIEYAFVDWKNSENNVYCLVNKTDGKICFLGKDFGVVETCKDNFTKEQLRMMYVHMKEKGAFFVLAGSDLYDEYGDEKNITEDMKCRIAFLDRKTQTVSWKDISSEVYQAFQDNCVSVGNQDFYYSISGSKIHCIDFVEHAYKEINLANTMVQQAGTVEKIKEDYGKLYLHYYILDGKRRYYGYADLDGNILFDAAVLKSTDEYLEFDKIGEYFFCSNKLFDKDYKLIMDNASYWCLRYYDEVKQQYMESDFYTVYSTDKNSGEGFLYDAKTDRIILKFKDTGKRYRYGTVMGDYIMLTEEDNHYNSIYVNTATGKVEKELNNHYSIVDT